MINLRNLKAVNELFFQLNILRRWTSFINEGRYNELAKQGLNCLVTYILAVYCEKQNVAVHWEKFPKIALYRSFQKVNIFFDMPQQLIEQLCEFGNLDKNLFNQASQTIIEEKTDSDFASFICDDICGYELRIYKAASKIATYIELLENRSKIMDVSQEKCGLIFQETMRELEQYYDVPGVKEVLNVDGNVFKILQNFSRLRNQNRWVVRGYQMECSILGHLFDTAVFAWLSSLEQDNRSENIATNMFFIGIFHDVAEVWTTDIQSPLKDKIQGFRKITEEFELKVIEENLYQKVPQFLENAIRKVMLEDEQNIQYKKVIKGADYLSAASEDWRQYFCGSKDPYFKNAILQTEKSLQEGKIEIGSVCQELFYYFKEYALKLNLQD